MTKASFDLSFSGTMNTKISLMLSKTKLFFFLFALLGGCSFFPALSEAAPQVSISASPDVIYIGESSTLTWTISGAASCFFAESPGSGSEGSTTNGSSVVHPRRDTQYSISCEDSAGEVSSAYTRVAVIPRVTVSIDPTTSTSTTGQIATVTWSSDGDSCRNWSGTAVGPSGSAEVAPSSTTTYTVTCLITGGSRNGSGSATITFTGAAGSCDVSGRTTWTQAGRSCFSNWSGFIGNGGAQTVYNDPVANPGYSGSALLRCNAGSISVQNPVCEVGFLCTGPEPHLFTGGGGTVEVYPGEEVAPTDGVRWQYSATNTSRACEFHCGSGSEWRPS